MAEIIQFPNKNNLSREDFKEKCHKIIDRLEGDFSIVFDNSEDIFINKPKGDTVIVTTNSENHKAMNSSFKNKSYFTQIKEE